MPTGRCSNCDEHCGPEDFCSGCGTYVCVNCNAATTQQIVGHDPEAHLVPDWWPEDESNDEDEDDEDYAPDVHADGEICDCPNGGLL